MTERSFQEYYPPELSYCYGCGRLNPQGHHLKSYWEGEVSVARFTPEPYHTAVPGFVNGGVLASLVDCHGTGTAAAAAYRSEQRSMDSLPPHRFVTASLRVDYLKPTPIGVELRLEGRVRAISGRKVILDISLSAGGQVTVKGEVTAVEIPPGMWEAARTALASGPG